MGAQKIDTTANQEFHILKLPDLAFKHVCSDVEVQIKESLARANEFHVLDFSAVTGLDQNALGLLMRFQLDLKKIDKRLFSINVSGTLHNEFKQRGIDKAFAIFASTNDITKELQTNQAPKVDADVLKTFVKSAAKAFEGQVKIQITPGKISTKSQIFEADDVVAGRVNVKVEGFKGSVTICFSEAVFKKIYKLILDDDIEKVDKDTADAAGELMNMIYGHAKTILNQTRNIALPPALPIILLNPKVEKATTLVLCMPFTSEAGPFRIEIVFA